MNFLGVPRADALLSATGLYALAAAALVLVGLVLAARRDPAHGVLLGLLLVLPPLVIAVVQVPGTDNHVRYVIEALPALLVCLAYGAVELARRVSPTAAVAVGAALVIVLPVVDVVRGRHLPDYRYRGVHATATRHALDGAAVWLRHSFARDDLVFGYDPVWANAVLHAGGNASLKVARGTARAEGPLIVRSLDRLHGPVAHGWYVALVRRPAGLPAFRSTLGPGFEARRFGAVRGRPHDGADARPPPLRRGRAARVPGRGRGARRPAGADDDRRAQCRGARRAAVSRTRCRSPGVSQPVAASRSGKMRPIASRAITAGPESGSWSAARKTIAATATSPDDAPALVADGEDVLAADDHQHGGEHVRDRGRGSRPGRSERRDQGDAQHHVRDRSDARDDPVQPRPLDPARSPTPTA